MPGLVVINGYANVYNFFSYSIDSSLRLLPTLRLDVQLTHLEKIFSVFSLNRESRLWREKERLFAPKNM